MYQVRLWSTRHARGLETLYQAFERALVALDPVLRRIGYARLERPVAAAERALKGLLFDCQMCGQCALSDTGMSCPMNCPKSMRNGPCGGVRPDGSCEVKPSMRCVWVEAWDGSKRMRRGRDSIRAVRPAVDRRLAGTSSWLRVAREKAAQPS
jgi:Methylene-tetrahydrofolate reductase C terminal